ncbi:MAG TPA: bifunctional molybdenum cofactor biosynthesis protein MoaC/MoaB [Candidatus Limnocylindria bacterium]|jgi:cyclic pyranopterin phosphate synthase
MTTSHLGPGGEPRMVDVGDKPVTARRAVAEATVRMQPDTLATLMDAGGPKGDAFGVARLAGIGAAKRTSDLIPLCHPLSLDTVEVTLTPDRGAGTVAIRAEVKVTARTGVEMEALTAASVAALTLYDMAKALQRDIVIERVALLEKEGGRSGAWSAEGDRSPPSPAEHEAAVVTCSNRSAAGERDDTAGPAVVEALRAAGWDTEPEPVIVPDDESAIAEALTRLADAGHRLILTTGGTGLTPTDVTPAATLRVADRQVPGIAEMMRAAGLLSTPMASLSRGLVAARGATLIVNLPGSPKGAIESLTAALPVLRHATEQLAGGDH